VAASDGVAVDAGAESDDEPPQPAITAAAVSAASVTIVNTVRFRRTGANIDRNSIAPSLFLVVWNAQGTQG